MIGKLWNGKMVLDCVGFFKTQFFLWNQYLLIPCWLMINKKLVVSPFCKF